MLPRPLGWLRSLHFKLFLLTAGVTAALTIAVALVTSSGSRQESIAYAKQIAIGVARDVEAQIHSQMEAQKDFSGEFRHEKDIDDAITKMAMEDKSITQIDVFRRSAATRENPMGIEMVASSLPDDEMPEMGSGLASHLKDPGPQVYEFRFPNESRDLGCRVYLPIESLKKGKPPIGLIRVEMDLERWQAVWRKILERTYYMLPAVIAGEFLILWVVLGFAVSDPLRAITRAMKRMEDGDMQARAEVRRKDELGAIATQFNALAERLHMAHTEREALIAEIQALNQSLQVRVDEALGEVEALNERNALLREEMGQQERLAVAGQLTAAFAHEVGTPLNLVNSHLQLLLSQTDLPPKSRERLDVIHTQIQRVGDIVRKLLGLTRRPQLNLEPTPLVPLIESLHHLWMPTLTTHNVHFELDAPDDCTLLVDRKQMEQIFINLVNNAVDAMPDGGRIELRVGPDATATADKPRWICELEDTGGGIPADLLPKVFKPMFTTKPEGKGTGLGLSIVREIVRNHGSEVRIESREGVGTTVIFPLPGMPA